MLVRDWRGAEQLAERIGGREEAGGTAAIDSAPGAGTRVRLQVPYDAA